MLTRCKENTARLSDTKYTKILQKAEILEDELEKGEKEEPVQEACKDRIAEARKRLNALLTNFLSLNRFTEVEFITKKDESGVIPIGDLQRRASNCLSDLRVRAPVGRSFPRMTQTDRDLTRYCTSPTADRVHK